MERLTVAKVRCPVCERPVRRGQKIGWVNDKPAHDRCMRRHTK